MKGTLRVVPGVLEAAKEQVPPGLGGAALTAVQCCTRGPGLEERVRLGSCSPRAHSGPQFPFL